MKEIMNEMPQKVAVSKIGTAWLVTINIDVKEVEGGYTCNSHTSEFDHRPTHEDVLSAVVDAINSKTDETILSGYVWNGKNVWLSSENQFNFKAAYDVAVQTNGANLPIKFKLGESNGEPVYHTFKSMNAFADFYTGAIVFIQQTLVNGWSEKDAAKEWVKTIEL